MFSITRYLRPAAILLACFCMRLEAEEIRVPIQDFAVISNENAEIRLLMNFAIPENVSDSTLEFAELRFGIIPALVEDRILRIDCIAVTTNWNSQDVDWNHPWNNPGGDFEESESTAFTTGNANADQAYFDLTGVVRSWLRGERANIGLIFMVPDWISSGFAVDRLPDLPEDAMGVVTFITK